MTVYKLRNPKTGLYASGQHTYSRDTANGRIYNTLGRANAANKIRSGDGRLEYEVVAFTLS